MLPWVGLQFVIVIFPGHTHILIVAARMYTCKGFEFVPKYLIQLFLVFFQKIELVAFLTACILSFSCVSLYRFWCLFLIVLRVDL